MECHDFVVEKLVQEIAFLIHFFFRRLHFGHWDHSRRAKRLCDNIPEIEYLVLDFLP